ncbi:MAG: glycine zipper 2TM domain-containing protein [Gallionellaceae bacterium]
MKTAKIVIAAFLATATMLSGCANTSSRPPSSSSSYYGADHGVIEAIETAPGSGQGIGAGTVIGGVVGGVLGHQVGGGTGQDVATVAGVVGGAMVGHEMEKNKGQQDAYRIRVRLENGQYQTVTQESVSDLRVGDRVRIENGRVSRY